MTALFMLLLSAPALAARSIETFEVYGASNADPRRLQRDYGARIHQYLLRRAAISSLKKQELSAGSRRLARQRQRENSGLLGKEELEMLRLDGEMAQALSVLRRITLERELAAFKLSLERDLQTRLGAAWVGLECIESPKEGGDSIVHVTIEVVERKDRAARMPFRPPPSRKLGDPNGLLSAWNEYSELGWELVGSGQLRLDEPARSCGSLYCLWNGQTPRLKEFEERFARIAPSRRTELLKIALEDAGPARRATAAFLLTYALNAAEISQPMTALLLDPSPQVRSAALQIFAHFAMRRKDVLLPIGTIEAAMDFPTIEDRNKALGTAIALSESEMHRPFLVRRIAPRAVKLLASQQPTTRELAHSFLRGLFKQDFSESDRAAWARHVERFQDLRR